LRASENDPAAVNDRPFWDFRTDLPAARIAGRRTSVRVAVPRHGGVDLPRRREHLDSRPRGGFQDRKKDSLWQEDVFVGLRFEPEPARDDCRFNLRNHALLIYLG
jgi:hypothetical protein